MKIQIKNRFTGAVIYEGEYATIRLCVEEALSSDANLSRANLSGANLSDANLYGANLSRANLSGANLSDANLYGANLYGANLYGANLSGADLSGADLSDADLSDADLSRANLSRANLSDADLSRANLSGANLYGADLSDAKDADLTFAIIAGCALGVKTLDDYIREVVPALLTAGGKTIKQIIDAGAWECHTWQNCPMAEAFSVHDLSDIPAYHRPRANQFIELFDRRMIPLEKVQELIAPSTGQ